MALDSAAPEVSSATQYRALSSTAVISLVFGVLSILTALWWPLAIIPIVGIYLGFRAKDQISKAPGEWTGLVFAKWGIGVSIALWVVGYGYLVVTGATEIPYGYELITYEKLKSDPNKPTELVPEYAKIREDKKVFIRGYMRAGRQHTGIKDFKMSATKDDCPSCVPVPRPTDSIHVILKNNATTGFTTHEIGVAGKLHIEPSMPGGIPYTLEDAEIRSR
jgi:hypothetical protein